MHGIHQSLRRSGRRLLRSFIGCRRGTSIVEFALVFPVLVIFVIGLLEVGMMMFVQASMEGAIREASRYGITGQVPSGMTRQEMLIQILEDHTYGFVDFDTATVKTLVYDSFEDVGQLEPYTDSNSNGAYDVGEPFDDINGNGVRDDRGVDSPGDSGDVVFYEVEYDWTPLTGFIDAFSDGDGTIHLSASTVVKNEPY